MFKDTDTVFCSNCGAQDQQPGKKCENCGSQIPPSVVEPLKPPQQFRQRVHQDDDQPNRWILWLVFGALLVAAIVALLIFHPWTLFAATPTQVDPTLVAPTNSSPSDGLIDFKCGEKTFRLIPAPAGSVYGCSPEGQPIFVTSATVEVPPIAPTIGPAAGYDCPTLQKIRSDTGLDWTRLGTPESGENCSYVYNTANYSYAPMPLLQGWMTTTARDDELVHVKKGDGTTVMSKATTIRLLAANPGLTSERQTDLTKAYAPSAGYSPDIVTCDDCSAGYVSSVTPAALPAAPSVTGFNCSPIDGGYVCKANPPANFVVPFGWKAYAGIPAQWYPSGTDLGPQSQVSLYPQ